MNNTPVEVWLAGVIRNARTANILAYKHREQLPRSIRRRWFGYFNLNQTIKQAIRHARGH